MFNIDEEKADTGLEEFVPEFLEDRKEELIEMKTNLSSRCFEKIRQFAHKWKGFSRPYGFFHLELLAEKLEVAASASNQQETDDLISQIETYLRAKEVYLTSGKTK